MTGQDSDATAEVARLREQRTALEQLTRELMVWIGLLRHKAMSLRALAGGQPAEGRAQGRFSAVRAAGLTPGSLDPRALADELAAGISGLRPRSIVRAPKQFLGSGAEEALERARSLWDTVADPADALACARLSEAADRLAAQLEARVDDALDLYRNLGDELVRAMRRVQRKDPGTVLPEAEDGSEDCEAEVTPSTDA